MKKSALLSLGITVFLFASSFAFAAEKVRIVGAGPNAFANLQKLKGDLEKETGAEIEIVQNPSDTSLVGLAKGIFDLMLGAPPEEAFTLAEKRGLPHQNLADYETTPFTIRYVKLALHPSNPVTKLTKEQIAGIFSNKVANWKEINGNDLPITIIQSDVYMGSETELLRHYLGFQFGKEKLPAGKTVKDRDGQLRAMKSEPGAVSVIMESASIGDFTPKILTTEARRMTVVTIKKAASPAAKKIFEFFKKRGPVIE